MSNIFYTILLRTILLALLFAGLNLPAAAQEKNRVSRGLYFGGEFYPGSSTYGYYWFGKDSSFIMLSFKEDSTVLNVGAGKYYIKGKNILVREFRELPALYYNNHTVQYQASTLGSPDSLYFSGTISDANQQPLKVAALSFPGIPASSRYAGIKPNPALPPVYKGVVADTNGRFRIVLPVTLHPQLLRFTSPFACPLDISLLKNFNTHNLQVSLSRNCPQQDKNAPSTFSLVEPVTFSWPLKKATATLLQASADSKLTKMADSPALLLLPIRTAKQKQPNLKLLLDWVEEIIIKNL